MSKSRRQRRAAGRLQKPTRDATPQKQAKSEANEAMEILRMMGTMHRTFTRDSFSNPIARTGFDTPNIAEGTSYPLTRLTNNYQLLNSLYRNSWIVRNVVDTIPEDMCKHWITIRSQEDPADINKIDRLWRSRQLKSKILHGLKWGRLYGGAVGLMMIEGEENLSEPLNLDMVMPGSFKNIMVIDRWTGAYPGEEIVDDPSDLEFGKPKYYEITMQQGSYIQRVHHSRVLRFMGRQLPYWEELAEVYWGASEVEIIYEELKKRDNLSANILLLSFMAQLRFMKINGLDQMMSTGDQQAQQELYNAIQAMNWQMSNGGIQILGENDDFQTFQYSFAGLNDIYQSFMMDVAGAAKTPVTKLFGRSPAGMNATGENDMDNYYDTVEQAQESSLAPVLDKLLPVMFMSELGYIPDDWDYDFNPIQEPSEKEVADLIQQKGTVLNDFYQSGILGRKTVLKELQDMSESTGMFTNITDEMIEEADDDAQGGEDIPSGAFGSFTSMASQGSVGSNAENRGDLQERDTTTDEKGSWLSGWFDKSR